MMALMAEGALVLTVNKRLSRGLVRAYERWMLSKGAGAWETPAVMPLASWVSEAWSGRPGARPAIPAEAASALWRRIVSSDSDPALTSVLLPRAVAPAASAAYSLMAEYGAASPPDIYLTPEAAAFKRWSAAYEAALDGLGFIDPSSVASRLARVVASGEFAPPTRVVLAGFGELTPSVRALADAFTGAGGPGAVAMWPDGADMGGGRVAERIRIIKYASMEEEVAAAARMARSLAGLGAGPNGSIAFIVPELERYVGLIEREFAAELDPRSVLPWEERTPVFNISLGSPLSALPLVKTALDVLSMTPGPFEAGMLQRVFMSRFIAPSVQERNAVAALDMECRRDGILDLAPTKLVSGLRGRAGAAPLVKRLENWLPLLREGGKARPSGWAARFSSALDALEVRANVPFTSREYQALEGWTGLLESLSWLDDALGPVTRAEALGELKALADETIHRPESPECGVEVMGVLESAGLYFDHVRIMGAHEEALPRPPAPNPFIPVWLQRSLGMPRSSHGQEAAFARAAVERILASAPSVEASYPAESDEKERRVSPIIARLGAAEEKDEAARSSRLIETLRLGARLEESDNFETIPVGPEELTRLKGGASILKEVAACPFMAFVSRRLHAEAMEDEPGIGILPEERGDALHEAMRLFWEKVGDSTRLKAAIESGGAAEIITASVDGALRPLKRPGARAFMEIERGRLTALIAQWLELEAQRGDFAVKELEATRSVAIGGLTITARIDRIDSSSTGGEIVLDYKTGKCSKNDWLTDRPKDPQLLLYASTGEFDAVSFASVRIDGVRFIGASASEGALPGVKSIDEDRRWREKMEGVETWTDLRVRWKKTLERLAADFLSGYVRVDPNEGLTGRDFPCERCDYAGICRVLERPGAVGHGDDEDGGDDE